MRQVNVRLWLWPVVAVMTLHAPNASAQPLPDRTISQTDSRYSEAELRAYVAATREIERISSNVSERASQGMNSDELTVLRREARADMADAIRQNDLSLDRYYAIRDAVDLDPSLASKIERLRNDDR